LAEAAWTAQERESFFDAIARHRRASWRVSAASYFANGIVALIVVAMMASLFYAFVALCFDVVNLVVHVPNVVATIGTIVGPLVEPPGTVPVSRWIAVALLATAPGLAWMTVLLTALRRMLGVVSNVRQRRPAGTAGGHHGSRRTADCERHLGNGDCRQPPGTAPAHHRSLLIPPYSI
jgi:hypothetical protein